MKKILVIQLARFGDLLQTKRLIRSLQRQGEVHVCVDRSLSALATAIFGAVSAVSPVSPVSTVSIDTLPSAAHDNMPVVVHAIHAHGNRDAAAVFAQNKRAFARLSEQCFDTVYNLNFSGLNFALSTLFDAESVRGYRMQGGQRLSDPWMRMAFRWTRDRRTSPLNLMDFWGLLAPDPVRPEEVNPIAMRKGGGIGVVLAGRMSRRSLPPEVLARCVQAVFEAHGGPSVKLLGTSAETPLARQVMRHFPKPLLEKTEDLSGRTDFAALMEVVGTFDVVLTPDTGTMHLAAHLGTPIHAFFLSSAWVHETGPYGLGHRVWQGMMPCSPCLESQPCPIQTECLNGFTDEIFLRMLAGKIDDTYPQNMLGFVSMLDSVGVTYMPVFGDDPRTPERKDMRMLVAERFGLVGLGELASNEHAVRLYHDADWILHHKQTEDI